MNEATTARAPAAARRGGPPARAVGIAVVVSAVALAAAAVVLDLLAGPDARSVVGVDVGWTAGLAGVALCVPGALLLRSHPRHAVAWVLCAAGLHWAVDGLAASWLTYATAQDPVLPGAALAHWVYLRLGAALLLWLPLLLLLYPGGRLPRGGWRVASLVSLATTALLPVVNLAIPSRIAQARDGAPLPEPFVGLDLDPTTVPLPADVWEPLQTVAFLAVPLSLVVPFAVVVRRYRAAEGSARRQLRWLVWAGVVDVLVMLTATWLLPPPLDSVVLPVAVAVTGVAVTVGIARPDAVDVDALLARTLRFAALALAVVVVDLLVLGTAGTLLGARLAERDAAILAAVLVVAVYAPLRDQGWRAVRRLVLGRGDDPYGVVAGLAEQLERSDTPDEQLLAVARTVAEAFRVPFVAVEVDRGNGERLVARHGHEPDRTRVLPVTYRGEEVGRLVLPRGGPRAPVSPRDERLLADVVRQAATAVRSSHLAEELQRSRERLVAAREEERRRLRRDLHDGLGPSLGAVGLRIDTARNLLARDHPGHPADVVLRQARDDATAVLADVRRLVHDLRPPALDDVGLLGAVTQQADRMRTPTTEVTVTGGAGLDSLPAAVEVAAYRIASEALANASRHAGARTVRTCLAVSGGALVVEVSDDGRGIAAGASAGVGLVSLRERAAELGGRCEVSCPASGGTVVRAVLPLGAPAAHAVPIDPAAQPEVSRA